MESKTFKILFSGLLAVIFLFGCENNDSSHTITGVWRCKEITSSGNYKVYNVSVEPYGVNDSTRFLILNFYNFGMDFETVAELEDSTFTIISSNNFNYNIQGTGVFHKKSYTIDWEYSIAGDPFVQAHFEKP